MQDFEAKLSELLWLNIEKVDEEYISHIFADKSLVFCAFRDALQVLATGTHGEERDTIMTNGWKMLTRISREETYCRVMCGRILKFFHDSLDAQTAICIDHDNHDNTATRILSALDETADLLNGNMHDDFCFDRYWNSAHLSPLRKSGVIDMFRRSVMATSLDTLQKLNGNDKSETSIQFAIAKVYCHLYSTWPSCKLLGARLDDKDFAVLVNTSTSKIELIAQLLSAANPDNWESLSPNEFADSLPAPDHQEKALQARDGLVLKWTHLTEVIHSEFVRSFTNIPVPRIKAVFYREQNICMLLEEVKGVTLEKALRDKPDEALDSISARLREFTTELASVTSRFSTSKQIGTLIGGSLSNNIYNPAAGSSLKSISEFFQYWKERLKLNYGPEEDIRKADELISPGVCAPIVFSHGDLSPANIILKVSEDSEGASYNIAAVIDWECSGFYPDFWEKVLAFRSTVPIKWVTRVVDLMPTSSEELSQCASQFMASSIPLPWDVI